MKKIALLFLLPFLMPVEAKPESATHLGQKIQDHVMLVVRAVPEHESPCRAQASFQEIDIFRVSPNGNVSSTPFGYLSEKV